MILWGKEAPKSGLRVSNKMNNGATEHSKTQARKDPDVKKTPPYFSSIHLRPAATNNH